MTTAMVSLNQYPFLVCIHKRYNEVSIVNIIWLALVTPETALHTGTFIHLCYILLNTSSTQAKVFAFAGLLK